MKSIGAKGVVYNAPEVIVRKSSGKRECAEKTAGGRLIY